MGFTPMAFDRLWTNPDDFPTYETHETQVREDMQYLFNSIKNQFNRFVANELIAENIPFAPTAGQVEASNVQAAIEEVYQDLFDIEQGAVADGAITSAKLYQETGSEAVITTAIRNGAVTTAKLADDAVTADKLADGAISTDSFADGAVTHDKLSLLSVGTENLIMNCVTSDKLANEAVTTQRIKDLAVITAKLAASAVTTAKIADLNVTTGKLAELAVTTAKLDAGAVTSAKLGTSAVTTEKIAANAVTYAKTSGVQKQHTKTTVTLASGQTSWTVSATGVTASNDIFCSGSTADSTSYAQWSDNRIRCTAQADGSLTFTADTAPSSNVVVNVLIMD